MKFPLIFASSEKRADARRRAASAWIVPLEVAAAEPSADDEFLGVGGAHGDEGIGDEWTDTASGRVGDRLDPATAPLPHAQGAPAVADVAVLAQGAGASDRHGCAAYADIALRAAAAPRVVAPAAAGLGAGATDGRPAPELGRRALRAHTVPSTQAGAERAIGPSNDATPGGSNSQAGKGASNGHAVNGKSDGWSDEAVKPGPTRANGKAGVGAGEPTAHGDEGTRLNARISRSASSHRAQAQAEKSEAASRGRIGAILVESQRMSAADAQRVADTQIEVPEPFGQVAVRLGLATQADVHFALARQFSLPRLENGNAAIDPEVIAAFDPGHALVEHLRGLRNQIALRALEAAPSARAIAVVGADRRAGRSYIAANLATVFAQLGARTLLVDADFLAPRQHALFRLGNRSGLSSILAGRADLGAACPVPGLPGFAVIPAGPTPPNPHDLIARPLFGKFLRRCEQDFDVILLDTPAWSAGTSARMAAAAAGAALLLVQNGRTAANDASAIAREFAGAGTRFLGAVVNRAR